MEQVAALGEQDIRSLAGALADAVVGALEKIVAEVGKQLDEKIANVERDAARRNNQPGG